MKAIGRVVVLLPLALYPYFISAETVLLNDGKEVRGRLISNKEGMTGLECDEGLKVYFPTYTVQKVEPGVSPYEQYLEYKKEAEKGSREVRKSLINWCKSSGLKNAYRLELISLAFDDAKNGVYDETLYKPMEEVGYVLHNGKWLTKTEYNLQNGLVYFEGQWMRKDVKNSILARRDYEKKQSRATKAKEQKNNKRISFNSPPSQKQVAKATQKVCYLCSGTGKNRGFWGKCPNCSPR